MRIGIRKMEAYTKPDVPKSPSATALPMNPPFEQTVAYCNTGTLRFRISPKQKPACQNTEQMGSNRYEKNAPQLTERSYLRFFAECLNNIAWDDESDA